MHPYSTSGVFPPRRHGFIRHATPGAGRAALLERSEGGEMLWSRRGGWTAGCSPRPVLLCVVDGTVGTQSPSEAHRRVCGPHPGDAEDGPEFLGRTASGRKGQCLYKGLSRGSESRWHVHVCVHGDGREVGLRALWGWTVAACVCDSVKIQVLRGEDGAMCLEAHSSGTLAPHPGVAPRKGPRSSSAFRTPCVHNSCRPASHGPTWTMRGRGSVVFGVHWRMGDCGNWGLADAGWGDLCAEDGLLPLARWLLWRPWGLGRNQRDAPVPPGGDGPFLMIRFSLHPLSHYYIILSKFRLKLSFTLCAVLVLAAAHASGPPGEDMKGCPGPIPEHLSQDPRVGEAGHSCALNSSFGGLEGARRVAKGLPGRSASVACLYS